VNKKLSFALPARNLSIAREAGLTTVLAPCAACYNRLITTHRALTAAREALSEIEGIIERPYDGKLRILNALEYVSEVILPRLRIRADAFTGARFAPYYGCLLVRPPKVTEFDDAEDPTRMDDILRGLGAEVADWEYKVECCGGGHSLSRTDIVVGLAGKILAAAREAGADAIVTACPMCHTNLDLRQLDVMRLERRRDGMPVYYLTEIVGLAAGIDEKRLGIKRHFVEARGLVERAAARAKETRAAAETAKAKA
jgi:heterodisulfide reductase subunit B